MTYTADDVERFMRWFNCNIMRSSVTYDHEGVLLTYVSQIDGAHASTRFKSLNEVLDHYYGLYPNELENHRRMFPLPIPGARRSGG